MLETAAPAFARQSLEALQSAGIISEPGGFFDDNSRLNSE